MESSFTFSASNSLAGGTWFLPAIRKGVRAAVKVAATLLVGLFTCHLEAAASTYNLRRLPLSWNAIGVKINSYGDVAYTRDTRDSRGDVYFYRTLAPDPRPVRISRGVTDCFYRNDVVVDRHLMSVDISDTGVVVYGCRSASGEPAHVVAYNIHTQERIVIPEVLEDQLRISRDGTKVFFYGGGRYVLHTIGGATEYISASRGMANFNRSGQVVSVHQTGSAQYELRGPEAQVRPFPQGLGAPWWDASSNYGESYWQNSSVALDNAGNTYIQTGTGSPEFPVGLYRWPNGAAQPMRVTAGDDGVRVFVGGSRPFYRLYHHVGMKTEITDGLNLPEDSIIQGGDFLEGSQTQSLIEVAYADENGNIIIRADFTRSDWVDAYFYSGPIVPSFKVLLNGKEYLFDDCAPFDDPCKQFASTHTGGEFLAGDTVHLQAQSIVTDLDLCEWTYGPVGGQMETLPAQSCRDAAAIQLPIPAPGGPRDVDFQVSLKMNEFPVRTKLLKVREKIEIAFAPGNSPQPPEMPYPTYWQVDYFNESNQWHKNGGSKKGALLRDGGCVVTSLAMLAGIKDPGRSLDPPKFNRYLAEEPFEGFDGQRNVLWSRAVKAINELKQGAPTLVPADAKTYNPNRATLEHLARKRKLMILRTHSRNHTDQDDPKLAPPKATWVKPTGHCSRTTPNITECHKQHDHFMVVSGLGYLDGSRRILLRDPGYRNKPTISLDHTRKNKEGYDKQVYGLAVFTPEGGSYVEPRLIGSIEALLDGSDEQAILVSPSGRRLGVDPVSHEDFREIPGGVAGQSGIARDGDDSDGDTLSSGVQFSVPSSEEGAYTIQTKLNGEGRVSGSAVILGSDGSILGRKFFHASGAPGELVSLTFSTASAPAVKGTLAISGMRFSIGQEGLPGESEFHGTLSFGSGSNGINPAGEEITFLVGFSGSTIPVGSMERIGSSWVYYRPDQKEGIYDFRLKDDGGFVVRARNISFQKTGDRVDLKLSIGDDEFKKKVVISSTLGKPFALITPDRLKYAVGGKANVTVEVILKPQGDELETVAVLKKNGEEQYPQEEANGVARYRLSLNAPGVVALEAQVYQQQKRLAQGLVAAIKAYRLERDEIRNRLEDGVDSETKAELEKRLTELESRIALLRAELGRLRAPIGSPVREEVYVE